MHSDGYATLVAVLAVVAVVLVPQAGCAGPPEVAPVIDAVPDAERDQLITLFTAAAVDEDIYRFGVSNAFALPDGTVAVSYSARPRPGPRRPPRRPQRPRRAGGVWQVVAGTAGVSTRGPLPLWAIHRWAPATGRAGLGRTPCLGWTSRSDSGHSTSRLNRTGSFRGGSCMPWTSTATTCELRWRATSGNEPAATRWLCSPAS